MRKALNSLNKQEGFTLIELMIVVAIIGILAAIAIPQFASYRKKAFNSAAQSDLRTIMTAEESDYASSQSYTAVTAATGAGPISGLTGANASKNVGYIVNIGSSGGVSGAEYGAFTGHSRGDTVYGGDSAGKIQYKSPASGNDPATDAKGQGGTSLSGWGGTAL